MCYSPWGHKESDTTERLHFHFPMWLSGKESAFQCSRCRRRGFHPRMEDPLEEEMATHSSILVWKIPWTDKSGGLQSTGLQSLTRVGN